ncbi:MAG: peptidylprolyl isomerase [Leptospiraceae bacterium]|nr:peptidylprolyl isomerase [Leptospiraceae bacterium]
MQTSEGEILLELFDRDAPKTVQNFIDLAQGEKETISPKGEKQKKRFYDGLTFHRIIEGFMIQGGCPKGDGTGGPGYQFEDEINAVWLGLDKVTGEQIPFYDRYIQEVVLRNMAPKSREELESRMQEFDEKFKKAKKLPIIEVLYRIGYRYNEVLKSHKSTRGRIAMANAGPNTNGSQFFINQVDTPHLDGLHTVFGEVVRGMEVVDKIAKIGDKKNQTENSNPITIQQVLIVDRR